MLFCSSLKNILPLKHPPSIHSELPLKTHIVGWFSVCLDSAPRVPQSFLRWWKTWSDDVFHHLSPWETWVKAGLTISCLFQSREHGRMSSSAKRERDFRAIKKEPTCSSGNRSASSKLLWDRVCCNLPVERQEKERR